MIKIFIGILLNLILGRLKSFALDVVSGLNAETLTNEEKREKAFIDIRDKAIVEGKTLRDSIINLVVELAVSLLKK